VNVRVDHPAVYTAAMEINPATISQPERYKLLIGCIVPRPIAFVSTISIDGMHLNLAPFSFFNGVGSNPMTLLFCPANKADGSEKDTLRNCKPRTEGGTGQFVVNVVTEEYIREAVASSEPLAYGESEFEMSGLTPAPSVVVKPPRVKESPVAFECETVQVVRTNPGAPAGGNVVIGRVVHVFVLDDLINERLHTDPAKLKAVGRMGGLGYTRTRDRFELPMSRDALRSDVPTGAEAPPSLG
jgi:flavin reductase (DIM6/NTAB) family NADH-FMN oxidoreductase RutF